jgi:hypothetical protein
MSEKRVGKIALTLIDSVDRLSSDNINVRNIEVEGDSRLDCPSENSPTNVKRSYSNPCVKERVN